MSKWISFMKEVSKGALIVGLGVYGASWLSKKFPVA